MTTEWQRPSGNDPRFDLTEGEVDALKFLAEAFQTPDSEFDEGEGVGAVRAFIDGQPVTVVILYRPSPGSPTASDMMPMAVLVNETVFDLLVPPPQEGEE